MPHISLEYSVNVLEKHNLEPVMAGIQKIIVDALPAQQAACKCRILARDAYLIGDGGHLNAFVHLDVKVKSGRSPEAVSKTAGLLLEELNTKFSQSLKTLNLGLSVEIHELSHYYMNS